MSASDDSGLIQLSGVMLLNLGLIAYVCWCISRGFIWSGHRWGLAYPKRIERTKEPARFKRELWSFIIFEALFFPFTVFTVAAAVWPNIGFFSR